MITRVTTMMLAMLLAGCAFKGGDVAPGAGDGRVWHAEPTTARVYPSTRFIRGQDGDFLEARVELLDQMGDSIKGSGEFRLELFAAAPGREPEAGRDPGRQLYAWQVPMRMVEQQRLFYDSITRAYQFRLRIDDPAHAAGEALLRVTFLPADGGERIAAEAVVGGG